MKRKFAAALALCAVLLGLGAAISAERRRSTPLPVLMYHHFAQEVTADTVVSPGRLREQLTALRDAGYTAVTLSQLTAYAREGTPLPDKPVLITMDDGYTSNLTVAAPILEELDMCATVFVIGINEGQTVYAHPGNPLYPARFSYEEAAPWVEKGVLDLQCHSFDMHQQASQGYSGRDGMLALPDEGPTDHQSAVGADLARFRAQREGRVGTDLCALAYPYGYYTTELDGYLAELGCAVTFTVDEHCSRLRAGDPASLRLLGRFNVTENWSGRELVARLERERR